MKLNRLAASATLKILKALAGGLAAGDRSYIAREIMADRFSPDTRALGDLFSKALLGWKNKQYHVEANGEAALLRRLKPFKPAIVFDVGANVGDWSLPALKALPQVQIHAFEIAPLTAQELQENLGPYAQRAVINKIGLGGSEGEITLYFSPDSSTAASTVPGVVEFSAIDHQIKTINEVTARITTGDAYMREHGIDKIDFLKIDVEGAEWDVLKGFSDAFARQKIQMVQFEYGPLNLKIRQWLGDYWKFFTDNGFVVGKLYPEGVAFKAFDLADEDFVGPNFIACLAERRDLIDGLKCEIL